MNWNVSMNIKLFCKNLGLILFANFLMGCASQLTYRNAIAQESQSSETIKSERLLIEGKYPLLGSRSAYSFLSPRQEYMFNILVAEIARLNGNYILAAKSFFDIASKARDWKMAERATQAALYAQRYYKAAQAAHLWVALAPNDSNAREILVNILLSQKRIDEAVVYLEAIFDNTQDNDKSLKSVIENILEQKNPAIALKLLEKLIAKHPDHSVILFAYSRLLIQGNQFKQALEVLKTLLSQIPDHAEAVPLYAYLLNSFEQYEEALQWMKKALQKKPAAHEWRLIYARMLADAEKFDEAIKQFKRLLSQHPKHGEFLYALGVLSLQIQQLPAAKNYFTRLLKSGEQVNMARYYLGVIAQDEKNIENALSWFEQVESGSNYLNAQARIASIFVNQGQLDKAVEHLRNVPVANVEEKINLIQMEAEILIEQKRYEQALEAYHNALELKPDNIEVLYMRSLLYEKMGNMALLEQDLRRVLVIDPENVGALNALGYGFTEYTVRYQEAYELIKKALTLSANDYYILDSMGWVLYKMGNYAEAIAYLRKAQAQQDDPEIAAHLGEVLWKSGEQRAATDVWEKAQNTFPDDEKLREVIDRFIR